MERLQKRAAFWSALTYTAISLALALGFFALATGLGRYPTVARYGGAIWVFLLSMIVAMPLVTSYFKRHYKAVRGQRHEARVSNHDDIFKGR